MLKPRQDAYKCNLLYSTLHLTGTGGKVIAADCVYFNHLKQSVPALQGTDVL